MLSAYRRNARHVTRPKPARSRPDVCTNTGRQSRISSKNGAKCAPNKHVFSEKCSSNEARDFNPTIGRPPASAVIICCVRRCSSLGCRHRERAQVGECTWLSMRRFRLSSGISARPPRAPGRASRSACAAPRCCPALPRSPSNRRPPALPMTRSSSPPASVRNRSSRCRWWSPRCRARSSTSSG